MPKQQVPTRGSIPRCTRRSRLIPPFSSSTGYLTPTSYVIPDLLDNHLDAPMYPYTQLQWLQSHHIQRYETHLNFPNVKMPFLIPFFQIWWM